MEHNVQGQTEVRSHGTYDHIVSDREIKGLNFLMLLQIVLMIVALCMLSFIAVTPCHAQSLDGKITVALTSAQISTLATMPVQILPAQGAGKMIVPKHIYVNVIAGTQGYTNAGRIVLKLGTTTCEITGSLKGPLASTISNAQAIALNTFDGPTGAYANQALFFSTDTDPTGGNGTISVTVDYEVNDIQ